jgi:RHS repeat-associated protein
MGCRLLHSARLYCQTKIFYSGALPPKSSLLALLHAQKHRQTKTNHAGRRVEQNISGQETHYLWDEYSQYGDVVLETRSTTTPYTVAYNLANGTLVSQTDNYGSLYFLTDAQNSTRALTDGVTGNVTSQFHYDAFGNLEENIAPATNYLYTGQQYDPTTELYSLRARYYDPSVGRFMSRDTWAYDYQNPVELNRYVYTHNNPVNYIDPSGNQDALMTYGALVLFVGVAALAVFTHCYYNDCHIPVMDFTNSFSQSVPIQFPELLKILLMGQVASSAAANAAASAASLALPLASRNTFDWNAIAGPLIGSLALTVANPVILYRGGALSEASGQGQGNFGGKLWLSEKLSYAFMYADTSGKAYINEWGQHVPDTSAIFVYVISRPVLVTLCSTGQVNPCSGLEYGFLATAVSYLTGPLVIPIPDNFWFWG